MIDRDRAAAVHQEIQHRHGPHQRVFQAGLVPEISADPPALVIGYDEKDHDRAGDGPGEQPKREHRTAHELRDRDGRRPEFSGTIAVAVERSRQVRQTMRLHPRRWKHPERVAQPMRDERKPHDGPQQRLRPWGERLIELAKLREEEWGRVSHLVIAPSARHCGGAGQACAPRLHSRGSELWVALPGMTKNYSLISPRLMLAPRRASTDFLLRPFADISTRYVPEPSSSLSNLKSPWLSLVVSATVRPSLLRRTLAPSTQSTTPLISAASVPPMKHFE